MLKFKSLAYTSVCSVLILSSLNAPSYAAPGDTFSFNNCTATGQAGPLQAACDAAYAGTSLDGLVTVTAGIQSWVVPETATYTIQAQGAAGGTNIYTSGGGPFLGGQGASIQGDVALTAGETIFFVVGQMGDSTTDATTNNGDNAGSGGGGGSFIYRVATDPAPLIAAGGGGGARCETGNQNANITADANDSSSPTGNAGLAGNGGTTNAGIISYWAGAGAGWLTDGTGGNNPTNNVFTPGTQGAEGGRSPQNGALGGTRWNDGFDDEGGNGGFGGGGGGGSDNMGSGGGGGFSGGGGGRGGSAPTCATNNVAGGGGGSFNSGANPVETAAANTGQGSIVVTQAAATAPTEAIPTTSFWGLVLLSSLLGLFGFSRRRKD